MPQAEIWTQYSLIAILILAAGVIALAFYKLWHELLKWIELQDDKREIERERQRVWHADQDKVRDLRWQEFLKNMQGEWLEQDARHSNALKQMVEKVDKLINAVNNHDTWARAKDGK